MLSLASPGGPVAVRGVGACRGDPPGDVDVGSASLDVAAGRACSRGDDMPTPLPPLVANYSQHWCRARPLGQATAPADCTAARDKRNAGATPAGAWAMIATPYNMVSGPLVCVCRDGKALIPRHWTRVDSQCACRGCNDELVVVVALPAAPVVVSGWLGLVFVDVGCVPGLLGCASGGHRTTRVRGRGRRGL